jgi:UDP-N-acetylglucosamine 3-dehydrogenase
MAMTRIRAAVIGAGNMGRNHVRILGAMPGVELVAVVDPDPVRAASAASASGTRAFATVDELPGLDLAVIATPTPDHAPIAEALMSRGISVLIEKPLASSIEEAERLVAAAHSAGVTLAVGHVERFNAVFETLAHIVSDPVFLQFERLSPFTPRIGDSVVFDLMVHDLDLACWIAGGYPVRVAASGASVFSESMDVATALLEFPSGCVARIDSSRATQDKVRRAAVSERERYIVADSLRQDISIKRQVRVEVSEGSAPMYREASIVEIPWLQRGGEPLARELEDFVVAVREGSPPRVTGEDGLAAVRLAYEVERAASRS